MILARPFKAGIKVGSDLASRQRRNEECLMISTVCSFRRSATENSCGWRGDPALKDRAKIIPTLRVDAPTLTLLSQS